MSRKDAVVVASRALAVLFTAWALGEVSYLPERLHSFLHYMNQEPGSSTSIQYWRHYYLITLGFLVTRIIGFSFMARWLYKGGADVEQLLSDATSQENAPKN
jgi:hypothetical protein